MHTYHSIFTALGLCGLMGAVGCDDVDGPPAGVPVHRNVALSVPALDACLTDTTLKLQHDDGTADVTNDLGEGFAALVRPGDLVELYYTAKPACAAEFGSRLTLAAYTSEGFTMYGTKPTHPPRAYDVHTTRVGEGEGMLMVRVPACSFQLELAFGEPLAALEHPNGSYDAEGRRIAATQGAGGGCGAVPRLEIAAFDTVDSGWGDAPLLARFGWNVAALHYADAPELTCALDYDGDGAADEVLSPCPHDTSKFDKLPEHAYGQPGEHRPEIVVSDGVRRLWARTSVLANHLEYEPGVRFPEQTPGFVGATLVAQQPPLASKLTLMFATKSAPTFAVGEVVVGAAVDGGYMLRVDKASTSGGTVTLYGTPVRLDEVIAGGYFGVRDLPIATDAIHCISASCVGTLTPVAEAPGSATPKPKPFIDGAKQPLEDGDHKYGFKIAFKLGEGMIPELQSEAELFGGVVVKKFAIDNLLVGDLSIDIDVVPTFEASIAVKAEIEEDIALGDITLGLLPIPVPVELQLSPRANLAASLKFSGKFAMEMPYQLVKNKYGRQERFAPKVTGAASLFSTPTEAALESKFSLVGELSFVLARLIRGPHVGPVGSIGIKAAVTPGDCKFCMTVFAELGVETGWNGDWWLGTLIEPVQVMFGEWELAKRCDEIIGECPPDPEPGDGGGGGGTWGDVHLVSHDGLLFDFQAGGEFVLVRATDGAPFEVQVRQEPIGGDRSLSYNRAVATAVAGKRVGLYADAAWPLRVDGAVVQLAPNATHDLSPGAIKRDGGGRYTITYPGGEQLRVDHVGAGAMAHLNVAVTLVEARRGHVEGLLGDADGDPDDDIGLGGGAHSPQPVTFQQLYRDTGCFTEAWRVDPAQSLFMYGAETSAETYTSEYYREMPTSTPAPSTDNLELAADQCGGCPAALRDTCMLDVAFTGDPAFAAACHDAPRAPTEVLVPADGFVALSPRYGAPIDCQDPKIVLRGPGLADAHVWPTGRDLMLHVDGYHGSPAYSTPLYLVNTSQVPPDGIPPWLDRFHCEPIGDGTWGECTLELDPEQPPCAGPAYTGYIWGAATIGGLPHYADVAYFSHAQ